jgi:hypothetical protein
VPWTLIRGSHGGIIGVHSASVRAPIKRMGFSRTDEEFKGKTEYAQWQFVHHEARTLYRPPVMLNPAQPAQ